MLSSAAEPDQAGTDRSGIGGAALDDVVSRLEDVAVRQLRPGDRLPSESDLATEYGVSRLTVREALKVLAGRGLVELGRGRRPTIREPDSSVLSGYLAVAMGRDVRAIFEAHTIRTSLEVLSATEAARNSSRAALTAVGNALDAMTAAATQSGDPQGWAEEYNAADVAFHEALALASGNRMLAFVLEGMGDALARSFALSFEGFVGRSGDVQESVVRHRRVFERVAAHDPAGAADAMAELLRAAESDLRHGIAAVR